jgi:hypothetical protein
LPFGKAGTFMDLVRKLVYSWGYLTDSEKAVLKQNWIAKGLPEELFDKIADKYNELQNFISQRPTTDMVLSWFLELEPHPQEAYVPKEEDQTIKTETEYEAETAKITPYWKQEGHKEGFLLRKLVNVFKGRDISLLKTDCSYSYHRVDQGLDFTLLIPAILIGEFEFYFLLDLPNPLVISEMPLAEIEKTLAISSMLVESGVNTLWLENLLIYSQAICIVIEQTAIISIRSPSFQTNAFEGKVLINQIPNAYVVVEI